MPSSTLKAPALRVTARSTRRSASRALPSVRRVSSDLDEGGEPSADTFLHPVYCLRILVDEEIPLNAGCLAPIDFKIPEGSIISPDETCAVVGGNVMTSQRVTDVVLRCFE